MDRRRSLILGLLIALACLACAAWLAWRWLGSPRSSAEWKVELHRRWPECFRW